MRNTKLWTMLALAASLCSCGERDEPASIEADIISFSIPDSLMLSPVKVGNDFVNAFIRGNSSDTVVLTPLLRVSAGASVQPASGEAVVFVRDHASKDAEYKAWYNVVSENGKNTKQYKVTLFAQELRGEYLFSFDSWSTTSSNGTVSYLTPSDSRWATGNPAVAIYLGTKDDPATYPTTSSATAVSGMAAKMQTIAGAPAFGAPIAAGNLFWGIFNSGNLLADKLTFTQFGQPFYQKPDTIKGYYRYKAGSTFTDKNNEVVVGRKDSCEIYAIFYETDEDQEITLDGRNIQTSELVVARAIMSSGNTQGEDYVEFSIPFVYDREPDFVNKQYKLTMVFTSSKSGGTFEGAVGSELLVDEVTLKCD